LVRSSSFKPRTFTGNTTFNLRKRKFQTIQTYLFIFLFFCFFFGAGRTPACFFGASLESGIELKALGSGGRESWATGHFEVMDLSLLKALDVIPQLQRKYRAILLYREP